MKPVFDLAVMKTKAQAENYVKTGKYSDKSKWSTRITRKQNKDIGGKVFYAVYIYKK